MLLWWVNFQLVTRILKVSNIVMLIDLADMSLLSFSATDVVP